MKKIFVIMIACMLVFSMVAESSFAGGCKTCKGKSNSKSGDYDGIEGKFYKKAMYVLGEKEELGLTDKQIADIKSLKKKVMKDLIQKDADISTVAVEIKSMMWETPFDVDTVNKLVEEKYELKKTKTQYVISSIGKLNGILTKEQLKQLK